PCASSRIRYSLRLPCGPALRLLLCFAALRSIAIPGTGRMRPTAAGPSRPRRPRSSRLSPHPCCSSLPGPATYTTLAPTLPKGRLPESPVSEPRTLLAKPSSVRHREQSSFLRSSALQPGASPRQPAMGRRPSPRPLQATQLSVQHHRIARQRIDIAGDQRLGQLLRGLQADMLVHPHPRLLRVAYPADKGHLRLVEPAGDLGGAPVGVALLDLVGREVGLRLRAGQPRVGSP